MDRRGGCRCGKVRYTVSGEPLRTGLCHCTSCRKESGSLYTAYAVWPRSAFAMTGEAMEWQGRSFCPICGSRLFALREDEAEIKIGSLDDAPNGLEPQYELWTKRREAWLQPVPGAGQYVEDRP